MYTYVQRLAIFTCFYHLPGTYPHDTFCRRQQLRVDDLPVLLQAALVPLPPEPDGLILTSR